VECRTCELLARRDRGEALLWDSVVRTPFWDLVHCDRGEVEGWMILVVRRHVSSVAELTETEAAALGPLARQVSRALTEVLGCESTYFVNFAEHPQHRHVHVHVIARAHDLAPEFRGPGIFQLLNVDESRNVSESRKNEIAQRLRAVLGENLFTTTDRWTGSLATAKAIRKDSADFARGAVLTADEACRLEVRLLETDVRSAPQMVDELLHPAFAEFGASGRVWGRADTIEQLAREDLDGPPPEVRHVAASEIAPMTFLVTYLSRKDGRVVRRSSIWVEHEGRLKVRWHQGTPTAPQMWPLEE
jgi:diadenosine tetraphosphate (Ap4A) HIT family hydrolase